MLSVTSIINEGKKARYIGAALSGLGGASTLGGTVGAFQGLQKSQYGKQIARQNKDSESEFEHQRRMPGRMIGKSLLGSIPIVGAVSNVMNQRKLEKQKDEIKKSFDK